ncbi:MAG TPA: NmrA/HSCARG family protein [Pseudonocardiaceae bacterium]|nr:NmrA/HSCARG family protein [Pseudonocardiaceae bacterium]
MSDKKIIAVIGATGAQGGGLARAILDDPNGPFTLRAITRDVNSRAASALADRGAEVVAADLDDEASIRAAFTGAYGAFVVTNFWAPLTPEQEAARNRARMELDQAATAARAAAATGLRHLVWSTLEDTRPHFAHLGADVPTLLDRYKVPHFDAKGEANHFFADAKVPTTFLETTMFYEALLKSNGQGPARNADGQLVLSMPMGEKTLAMVAAEDIGRTAYGIFKAGARYVGRTVGLAGAHVSGPRLAELLSDVLGEPVVYQPVTPDQIRASGGPATVEIANMYQFYADAGDSFLTARDPEVARTINPALRSLPDWLREHKGDIL